MKNLTCVTNYILLVPFTPVHHSMQKRKNRLIASFGLLAASITLVQFTGFAGLSELLIPTAEAATGDISVILSGPSSVIRGNAVTYTATVTNAGPDTADGVTISDPIPSGLTYNSGGSSVNCIQNGANILCNSISLVNGSASTVTISFNVPSTATCGSTISNQVTVSSSSTDPNSGNNTSATITTTVNCTNTADLSITKTGPTSVAPGGTLTYTATLTNAGPDTAQTVSIADAIPSGLTFNSGLSDSTCAVNGTNVLCNNITLASGQSRAFAIAFTVPSNATCSSTISNVATVSTSSTDPNSSNNTSTAVTTTVNCPPAGADLSITLAGPSSVIQGNNAVYTAVATNAGPATATNVTITQSVPTGFVFNSSASDSSCALNGTNVLCNSITLTSGQNRNVTIGYTVPNTASCNSSRTSVVTVSSSSTDPNSGNNTSNSISTQVSCPFTIANSDGRTTANAGETLIYSIPVSNTTSTAASSVTVADTLPSNVTFVSANNGGTHSNGTVTFANLTIPASQTVTLQITVTINSNAGGSVLTNVAQIVGTSVSATDTTTVNGSTQPGCIDVVKQTFTQNGSPLTPVPTEFNFLLDGGSLTGTNSSGQARFNNVSVGSHTVSEIVPAGWILFEISPSNGVVNVGPGPTCATVTFKNLQQPAGNPFLTITKTDNRTTVGPNENLIYTITVNNSSSITAIKVEVGDLLPFQTTFVSASDNGSLELPLVVWRDLTIPAGGSKTLTLTMKVKNNVINGENIVNLAQIHHGQTAMDFTTVVVTSSTGCIDIVKETFNTGGTPITPVAQFTFRLDGGTQTVVNDSNGNARFSNVPTGTHTVTETVPTGWTQLSVTPTGGVVSVSPGSTCSTVLFKNQQVTPGNATFSINKTDNRTTATPGQTLTYNITVQNTSSVNATNVTVTDTLPGNVSFQSANNNGSQSSGTITWSGLTINAGSTVTLTVNVTVNSNATNGTVLTNTAQVQGGPSAVDITTVSTTPPPPASLTISKTDNRTNAAPNDVLTYLITLQNTSPTTATNVMVTDLLPSNLTFVLATNNGSLNGQNVVWNNLTVNGNSSISLTLQARVNSTATNGIVLTNVAQISGGLSATDTTTVQGGTVDPNNVTIDLTDDRDPVEPNESFCYTLRITNLNSSQLDDQTITQTLDGKTEHQSSSQGGSHNSNIVTWNNIDIPANGTTTLNSCVRVKPNIEFDEILSSQAFLNNKNDTETTRVGDDDDFFGGNRRCDIQSVSDTPDPAQPGETITYSIRIRNGNATTTSSSNSSSRLYNIVAFVDNDLTFLSASNGGEEDGAREVEWKDIRLRRGESDSVRLTVRVKDTVRDERVRIRIQCEDDEEFENTRIEREAIPPSSGRVRVSLDKRASRQEAKPGDMVTYTITLRNLTNTEARDITVEDRFNAGSISIQDAGGGRVIGNGIDWEVPSLGANDTRIFTYRVRIGIDMRHGQVINNTVVARSDDLDRPATDIEDVRILTELPQTGIGGFFSSFRETSQHLRPTSRKATVAPAGNNAAAIQFIVWTSIISIGLLGGTVIGRKVFPF